MTSVDHTTSGVRRWPLQLLLAAYDCPARLRVQETQEVPNWVKFGFKNVDAYERVLKRLVRKRMLRQGYTLYQVNGWRV